MKSTRLKSSIGGAAPHVSNAPAVHHVVANDAPLVQASNGSHVPSKQPIPRRTASARGTVRNGAPGQAKARSWITLRNVRSRAKHALAAPTGSGGRIS